MDANQIDSLNLSSKVKNYIICGLLSFSGFMIYIHFFDKPAAQPVITIETNNDMRFLNDSVAWQSHEIKALKANHIKDSLRIDSLSNLFAK